MATNTSALKTFAQQTRAKLISLITTKMQFVLNGDTAELRGYEREISELRKQIAEKTEKIVRTWNSWDGSISSISPIARLMLRPRNQRKAV